MTSGRRSVSIVDHYVSERCRGKDIRVHLARTRGEHGVKYTLDRLGCVWGAPQRTSRVHPGLQSINKDNQTLIPQFPGHATL